MAPSLGIVLGNGGSNEGDAFDVKFERTVSKNNLVHVDLPGIGDLHTLKRILTSAFFRLLDYFFKELKCYENRNLGMVPRIVIYPRYLWNVQNDLNLWKIRPNAFGNIP